MNKNAAFKYIAVLGAALLPAALGAQQIIANENFSDGNRTGWYGSTADNLAVVETAPGVYGLSNTIGTTSNTTRTATFYFAPSNAPITLGQTGEKLSLSFDVTPTSATSPQNMRIGLLHSGTARLSADTNTSLGLEGGYGVIVNATSQRVDYQTRTETSAPIWSNNTGWSRITNPAAPADGFAFAKDTTYSILFEIERVATGIVLTYSATNPLNDKVLTQSYTLTGEDLTYEFDTLVLGMSTSFGDSLIQNVVVSYTAIPEASSYALIFGVVMLGALCVRRRGNRASAPKV